MWNYKFATCFYWERARRRIKHEKKKQENCGLFFGLYNMKTPNSRSIFRTNFVLLFILLFLLQIVFVLLVVVVIVKNRYLFVRSYSSQSSTTHTHRYSQIRISNNETTEGFAKISRQIPYGEVISFIDEETGVFTLISPIIGDEYVCTATCSCRGERRGWLSGSGKIIVISIIALSATWAIYLVNREIMIYCITALKDYCRDPDVITKTDCVNLASELDEGDEVRFLCDSDCAENRAFRKIKYSPHNFVKTFDCSRLTQKEMIKVPHIPPEDQKAPLTESANRAAEVLLEKMVGFCEMHSRFQYFIVKKKKKDLRAMDVFHEGNACVSDPRKVRCYLDPAYKDVLRERYPPK